MSFRSYRFPDEYEREMSSEQYYAELRAQADAEEAAFMGAEEVEPEVEPVVLAIESAIVAQDLQRKFDESHPH